MTRKLLIVVLLLMPLLGQADQRVWYQESGDYYDPANPWQRKHSYLQLPLPKLEEMYQVRLYYSDGQLALEGLSPTPDYDRKSLLGDVVEYYPNGQVSARATYVSRDQVCDCGNTYPVRHGAYEEYHPNGQIHRSGNYYGGGLTDGDYAEYDAEGRLSRSYSIRKYKYHGDYVRYEAGQLIEEAHYVNGTREGVYRKLDEHGRLIRKVTYLNGRYQGVLETYRDGRLLSEENFHEGDRLGWQRLYHVSGAPRRTYIASKFRSQPVGEDFHFRSDGSLSRKVVRILDDNGETLESRDEHFGENGTLSKFVHIKGGWQLKEEYNQSGEVITRREEDEKGLQGLFLHREWSTVVREHYQDGVLHGRFVHKYAGGSREEGDYQDGEKEGLWLTVKSDGATEKVNYRAGERHGLYQRFDSDGELTDVIHYQNGKKHGLADYSEPYGNRVVSQFYQGEPDGDYLETTDDGRIIHQGRYRQGKPEGVHYHFASTGQMLKKQSYKGGEAHGEWIEVGYGGMSVVRKQYENGRLVSEADISLDSEPAPWVW